MPCFHPLAAWRQPGGEITFHDKGSGRPIKLPCGQCSGCRLKRSHDWALRCIHEASLHSSNCFITLTYNDDNLPFNGSLNKSDFQGFIKRLRDREKPNKIRFYQAGEYGDKNNRPHHHAILFNYMPDDLVDSGGGIFFSPYLEKVWGKGFVNLW